MRLVQVALAANDGVTAGGGASRLALCSQVIGCGKQREREDGGGWPLVGMRHSMEGRSTLRMRYIECVSRCV